MGMRSRWCLKLSVSLNFNFRYWLTVIAVCSKFLRIITLKSKKGPNVASSFRSLLKDPKYSKYFRRLLFGCDKIRSMNFWVNPFRTCWNMKKFGSCSVGTLTWSARSSNVPIALVVYLKCTLHILLASFYFLFHALKVEGTHVYLNYPYVYHNSTSAHAEISPMTVCYRNSHVLHNGRYHEDTGPVATLSW